MERIRNLIELLKKHYEKVLVVVALLLLAANVWYLSMVKERETQRREEILRSTIRRGGKPVPPVNVARFDAALQSMKNPPSLSLAVPHHLVNPVTWYRTADGTLVKVKTGDEIGMRKMEVTDIHPLNLSITLVKAATSGSGDQIQVTGYHLVTTNAAAPRAQQRHPGFYTINDTNKPVFILRDVKGPADKPDEMVLEFKDTQERVSLSAEKPFVRTIAYEADLKYGPTGRTYKGKRKNDALDISGQPHKIVDISADKVVLSDDSNGATCELMLKRAP